jgi:2-oxoglutarate ferredoxin oxidoreductase subunit gamma
MENNNTMQNGKDRIEIRFSGKGGQGMILAGIILAEAAAIYCGKNAIQSQSYGPEARGGSSRADVIISNSEILYPKTMQLNYLVALSQEACDSYARHLRDDGLLIADEDAVKHIPPVPHIVLPLIKTARDVVGKMLTLNIVTIGVLVGVSGIVEFNSVYKAVKARVPKGTERLNLKALKLGYELAEKYNVAKKSVSDES